MGLLTSIVKSAVAAGARTLLDRIDPARAAIPPEPKPADAPSPSPAPAPVAAGMAHDDAPEPLSADDIERQLALMARSPVTELKLWAEEQQRLREEDRLEAPEYDPDFDEVCMGTTKGMEVLKAHGYRGNPWAA